MVRNEAGARTGEDQLTWENMRPHTKSGGKSVAKTSGGNTYDITTLREPDSQRLIHVLSYRRRGIGGGSTRIGVNDGKYRQLDEAMAAAEQHRRRNNT